MNESIDYMLNPDKYHTVPARNVGECDEQYKKRLKAYSIGLEKGAASRQAEIDELQKRIDDALEKCSIGIRKQGGDYYLELVEKILKGDLT